MFGFEAAGEASEGAGGTNDAVAGHDDGNRIAAVGGADGADGGGMVDLLGDLTIGTGLAEGDGAESIPDFVLERRAVRVERD